MTIKFVMKIVRLKVHIIFAIPITLTFSKGHNCHSKWTIFNLWINSSISDNVYAIAFKLGMTLDWCMT